MTIFKVECSSRGVGEATIIARVAAVGPSVLLQVVRALYNVPSVICHPHEEAAQSDGAVLASIATDQDIGLLCIVAHNEERADTCR